MNGNMNSLLRHPLTRLHCLLIVLAALAVAVLADGVVSAAPRQQTPPSNDATLSSLSLSDVDLDPAFASGTEDYTGTAAYDATETTVTATATDSNATVSISYLGRIMAMTVADGVVPLEDLGVERRIFVAVTAEDNSTMATYVINVTIPIPIVRRTIDTPTVAPGGTVSVTLTFGPGSVNSGTREILPDGFSWSGIFPPNPGITPGLPEDGNPQLFQVLRLGGMETSYTYTLIASTMTGVYTLTGTITDFSRVVHPVVGDTQITVALPPGVTVSPTDLTVDEGGTGTYTVALNTQPSADVTVTVNDPTGNTDVTADPASLTFTTTNWATAQTVTVSAAEDDDSSQDTATVTHAVAGGDYDSLTAPDVTSPSRTTTRLA